LREGVPWGKEGGGGGKADIDKRSRGGTERESRRMPRWRGRGFVEIVPKKGKVQPWRLGQELAINNSVTEKIGRNPNRKRIRFLGEGKAQKKGRGQSSRTIE